MNRHDPVETVKAWEQAVSALAIDQALELSDSNIEIVGPRGSAHGLDMLKDWLSRAGLSLETRHSFADGNVVVNEQIGVWRSLETGALIDKKPVASHYKVAQGKVMYIARYDTLEKALDEAGLTRANAVT